MTMDTGISCTFTQFLLIERKAGGKDCTERQFIRAARASLPEHIRNATRGSWHYHVRRGWLVNAIERYRVAYALTHTWANFKRQQPDTL